MHEAVVIGASAGGIHALKTVFSALPESFPLPIAVVQHIAPHPDSFLAEYLDGVSPIAVKEAEDKEYMKPGTAYLAPAGYHLLIEPDKSFSLSIDPRVNFSCPAIDVLFESAADVFGDKLIGVILTGANADGSLGLKAIKAQGGLAIVQDPRSAEAGYMPQAAIDTVAIDHILDINEIGPLLVRYGFPEGESDDI